MADSKIILAADELSLEKCLELGPLVGERLYAIKVHNLFDQYGPAVVERLRQSGYVRVWVDAKLHDIPNTVKNRAQALTQSGADIITVHASGGVDMMRVATGLGASIYAVTVLTSLTEEEVHLMTGQPSKAAVLRLAREAKMAGVNGIVCSAQEVGILAKRPELTGLEFIVPGIRSAGKDAADQKRVGTPTQAIFDGATRLVIGRQITGAPDPIAAISQIQDEI